MKQITMADCTKGELYDRCKELERINADLYEACKRAITDLTSYTTDYYKRNTIAQLREALAKVES